MMDIVRELARFPKRDPQHYVDNPHAAYMAALWLQSMRAAARVELTRLGYEVDVEGNAL